MACRELGDFLRLALFVHMKYMQAMYAVSLWPELDSGDLWTFVLSMAHAERVCWRSMFALHNCTITHIVAI